MRAVNGGFCIAAIDQHIDAAVVAQGNDQSLKHFIEADRVLVKMFRVIVWVDADFRQIQPIIGGYRRDIQRFCAQGLGQFCTNKTFAAAVDPGDADEHGAIRHNRVAFSGNRLHTPSPWNGRRVAIRLTDSFVRSLL